VPDWLVRHFGVRDGFFTPPFLTFGDMAEEFKGFTIMRKGHEKSIARFEDVNGEA